MHSKTLNYQLPTFTGVIDHGWLQTAFTRDTAESEQKDFHLEAQVRSGDYFITLATTLDSLGRDISDYTIRSNIEDIVSDLIFLHDNYSIDKNKTSE